MIRFACPCCQKTYQVSDKDTGSKFACGGCGQRVQIPQPPGALPPGPTWSRSRSLWWAGGALAGTLALAGCGLLLLAASGRNRSPSSGNEPSSGPSVGDLARRAQEVLRTHCYRCHGENGTAEGGVNFILDRDRLTARRKLAPGDPERSRLFRRVRQGEMPPEDVARRPGPDEIAALGHWIAAGAPAAEAPPAPRDFLAPDRLDALILSDLRSLPERDRRFARYFTLANLFNAGLSEDELDTYRHALSKLLNSLSWNRTVVRPRPVDPARSVYRIDVRDYRWGDAVWERLLAAYPYGVLRETEAVRECLVAAGGRLCHVRADWFVATASRPPLYHEVLQLPDAERRLEEQLHIDVREDVRQERAARAGFNGSGVSRNNRLIERHESPYGAYWKSYDFADNVGPRNLFAHPLGPGAGGFAHDGGEIIFSLPNGLHAYLLADGQGRRLDKAPSAVVSDPKRPDRAVENGLSCMTCHARGLIPRADQVRAHVERNLGAFAPAEAETVRALYPPEGALLALFEKDNERFRRALAETGCPLTVTEPIDALVQHYERELGLQTAAAELGLRPEALSDRLRGAGELARHLGPLRVPDGSVQRQVFRDAFPELVRALGVGSPLPSDAGRR